VTAPSFPATPVTPAKVAGPGGLRHNRRSLTPGAPTLPSLRRTLTGAFILIVAMVLFGWIIFTNTRDLVSATRRVERTRIRIGEIEGTLSTLKDAETGQRGYLLTTDPAYLEPYDAATSSVQDHLRRLAQLLQSDPEQTRRLQEFQTLVHSKLDELAASIRLSRGGDTTGALGMVRTGFGRKTMDRIREVVAEMSADENRQLARRSAEAERAKGRVFAATALSGACFLGLLVAYFLVVRADILGRAQAEAAARESEERLRTTLRSIGDAVLATDAAGRITFLNPVGERLTGWSSEAAAGQAVEDVFRVLNEASRQEVESPVRRVIREGQVVGLANHTILIARDGREIPIADSGGPIFDATQKVSGVVLVFRDISELRKAEQATQRLAAIVESANYAIVGETVHNEITDWNPGAAALFGFTAEEMRGRRMSELVPPGEADAAPRLTAELIAGQAAGEFEAHGRTKDGRWLETVVNLSPIRDEEGAVVGLSRIIRDVTERRRQNRELDHARQLAEQANAAKDRFLATLSHELRTPLTPVMASVQRLQRRKDLGPGVDEVLAMIRRNIELEARLIDDLLDLTRITKGKIELERQPLDLHALLTLAAQNARSEFLGKSLQLELDLQAADHFCMCDAGRLQQVFWNLLKNAVKFTDRGGRVAVKTRNPRPGRVAVSIQDTGRGIRPDLLRRIFEPFEQGDVTAVRRAGGLGLGLAIAQNLVQLHDGTIGADSEGEGRGATFTVELSTCEERPALEPAQQRDPGRMTARRRTRILLVEDDEDTAEALEKLLVDLGFGVRRAGSVRAAHSDFQQSPADVLITDVGLPDGSGLELLGALRSLQPELRGFVLSGYGMEEDVQRSYELGFAAHFVKPVNLNRLIAALDDFGAASA
jgi:two-component system, chemotaxis family, CheB/CheR fusion protein